MRTITLLPFGLLPLVGAVAFTACGSSATVAFVEPTGYETITSYGSCDTVDGYASVTADYCPGVTCAGDTYFAICDGNQWSGCDCTASDLTSYTVIGTPSSLPPVSEGGTEASTDTNPDTNGDTSPDTTMGTDGNADTSPSGDSNTDTGDAADSGTGDGSGDASAG
jgi:hypothetical protein